MHDTELVAVPHDAQDLFHHRGSLQGAEKLAADLAGELPALTQLEHDAEDIRVLVHIQELRRCKLKDETDRAGKKNGV